MARKRKAAGESKGNKNTKRVKKTSRLCNLPTEILDLILTFVTPDFTQLDFAADCHSTFYFFPNALLETCKLLRQRSLQRIQQFTWINLRFPSYSTMDAFGDACLGQLPILPRAHQHHVRAAPTVQLSFMFSPEYGEQQTDDRSDCFVPLNFASLIHICDNVSDHSFEGMITGFEVRCINIGAHAERDIEKLVLPALSTLRNLKHFKFESNESVLSSTDVGKNMYGNDWNLNSLIERAEHILCTSRVLKEADYVDESDMLLLSSTWLSYEAQDWLPNPDSWAMGELTGEDEDPDIEYPGRCAKGNRLRKLLFQIEHQACRSLYRLVGKFDWDWYLTYHRMFGNAYDRFIVGFHFTWFGATTLELAEMHFGRAIVLELLSRRHWAHTFGIGREWYFEFTEPDDTACAYRITPHPLEDWFFNGDESDGYTSGCTDELYELDSNGRPMKRGSDDEGDTDDDEGLDDYGDGFFGLRELAVARALDPKNTEYADVYSSLKHRWSKGKLRGAEKRCRQGFVVLENPAEKRRERRPIWVGEWNNMSRWGGKSAAFEWLPLAQKGLTIEPSVEDWVVSNLSQGEKRTFTQNGAEYLEQ